MAPGPGKVAQGELIIAAGALNKLLWRNVLASLKTELQRVVSLDPAQVLDELVKVLVAY